MRPWAMKMAPRHTAVLLLLNYRDLEWALYSGNNEPEKEQ